MYALASIHFTWEEHALAVEWFRKGAEAGLPMAMYNLAGCLDEGKGGAAPDCPSAANWYRRAVDAGNGEAAQRLSEMYTLGRGWAWQIMHASSSSTLWTHLS